MLRVCVNSINFVPIYMIISSKLLLKLLLNKYLIVYQCLNPVFTALNLQQQ